MKKRVDQVHVLQQIPSSVVMICVRFENSSVGEFIIVDNKCAASPENNLFHYASLNARELLSAAYAPERNHCGTLSGCSFIVTRVVEKDSSLNPPPKYALPTALHIQSDGGYSSSALNNNYTIIDLLLYSPLSSRYEIIRATYNKRQNFYFSDISFFRSFVRTHGKPRIDLFFESSKEGSPNWDNLNSESILKGYGYNVSQRNNLSDARRHVLLAEIIDLGILTASHISSLLDFFISTHPNAKDALPRRKWADDKAFVANYKANPLRFQFVQ